jgi:hypothetical protein
MCVGKSVRGGLASNALIRRHVVEGAAVGRASRDFQGHRMAAACSTVLRCHGEPQARVLNGAMNPGLREDDGRDRGPVPGRLRATTTVGGHPRGTDDEKDAMRWLASTAAEAVA